MTMTNEREEFFAPSDGPIDARVDDLVNQHRLAPVIAALARHCFRRQNQPDMLALFNRLNKIYEQCLEREQRARRVSRRG